MKRGKRHLNRNIQNFLEITADILGVIAFLAALYIFIEVYG